LKTLRILALGLLALFLAACFDETQSQNDLEGPPPSSGEPPPPPPPPENQPPEISDVSSVFNVTAGSGIQIMAAASDPEDDLLTFTLANRPAWVSFDADNGMLSGTPSDAEVGSYANLRISVSDGVNVTEGNAFRIVVDPRDTPPPPNRPPVITGAPSTSVLTGQSYEFTPTASDPDGHPLSFSIAGRPAWASFDGTTGTLTGSPVAGMEGNYANIRISVSDGTDSASLPAFAITVSTPAAPNQPPVIEGSPATTGREGIPYSFMPTASDPDGDSLTFGISNKPSWASFSTSSGRLAGTPPVGGAARFSGITITVNDGSVVASLPTFSIDVAANRAPTISGSPPTTVTAGQAYSFTPTASDPDGNALTFSISNRPPWANFSATSGRLSGTPSVAQAGIYEDIRISVSDGMSTTTLPSFEIEVEVANRPPVISGSPATSIVEGQSYSFTPTASDPDGDSLTFSVSNRPSWATFSTATGRLSGTPGAGAVGVYSNIQIRVSDGSLQANLPAFSIDVQQSANGSVTVSWTPPTTRTDGSALTDLSGFRLRYGNSADSYPNTIDISNPGVTTYRVENLARGTYYFVIAAYDSTGLESSNTDPLSATIQ
jgi:hypothetical protein